MLTHSGIANVAASSYSADTAYSLKNLIAFAMINMCRTMIQVDNQLSVLDSVRSIKLLLLDASFSDCLDEICVLTEEISEIL